MSYREQLWLSPWLSLLFISLIGLLSAALVIESCIGIPIGERPAPIGVLLGFDVFFILLFASFSRMDIHIDADRIEVKYGVVRKVIPMSEVESCRRIEVKFRTYGGQGIRLGTDGSLAFLTSFGEAVKVIRKTKRAFVFSTTKPALVSSLVDTLARKQSA